MKDHKKKRSHAFLILNISWGTLTIGLFIVLLYSNWQVSQLKFQQNLLHTVEKAGNQIDGLIQSLMQSVYRLPIHDENYRECTEEDLQHLVFNHPEISALAIKDKTGKPICSSIKLKNHLLIQSKAAFAMDGPLSISGLDLPVFLFQQRLGNYYLQVYVLEEVLARHLRTSSRLIQSVWLFDNNKKKIILYLEQKREQPAPIAKKTEYPNLAELPDITQPHAIKTKLSTLDDVDLYMSALPEKLQRSAWREEGLLALLLFVLAIMIYFMLRHWVNKRFSLRRAIKTAIKNERFYPVYQPIMNKKLGICCGAEVLTRLKSHEHEVILPDLFIEDAEQSGLIIPITLQLIEKSFQDGQSLLKNNANFYLSFNLSAIHFKDKHFFDSFYKLYKQYGISPEQIMFEITERDLLIRNDAVLLNRMEALRKAGFLLAVDDFGTGHASISYLQHFPFNYLKIDRLFIQAIGTGAITESLNQSIIHMAKNLKLNIIAEGVETEEQVQFLQENDVHLMQGWYFAKAMNLNKLQSFIKGVNHG
ncbi:EAL domain-containing protein [Legionella londiniensis]|uniref:Rtn protein n=1 Tax=Legionella londiniensis TaxID=45068 RepID=A0A0W0VKQ3_9GAMM|nr:EAL domain-containing protein [Legionella londiniensis]KTD20682.1 Rtn protein [Legionella londiniensis]STX92846.1 Rtn protein [Legionella londiniensis]